MQKNVLFDLDGTLLPMDLQQFIELYLQAFCRRFAASPRGRALRNILSGAPSSPNRARMLRSMNAR